MSIQIHWQEGLFLQPHHLQRMQRGLADQSADERRLGLPYPFGVIEGRVSRDDLENFRLRFDSLRVIMPSGLEVNHPGDAELPALDIKQASSKGAGSFNVLLAVPLWQPARANTVPLTPQADGRAKLLYRVGEIECADENTGENPKPLQIRKINSRLLFEHDDTTDMEVLPLLRVVRAAGQDAGLPREDPEFVPPCLLLTGSIVLRELVRDLVNAIEANRKDLVGRISRAGFSLGTMQGMQFEQILRLRTLNRFSARLPALFQTPNATPFMFYLEFRELLGELAALHPDRDEFESAPYNHESPYVCFRELDAKIRKLLPGTGVAPVFFKVPFAEDGRGILTAALTDEHLNKPNAYFLGINTNLDPIALARFVGDGDKFKLMPRSLVERAIRGFELKEERHPPMGLLTPPGLHYFRLDRDANRRMWEQVQAEKTIGVRWTGAELNWAGATFTLYMTVPG